MDDWLERARSTAEPLSPGVYRVFVLETDGRTTYKDFAELHDAITYADHACGAAEAARVFDGQLGVTYECSKRQAPAPKPARAAIDATATRPTRDVPPLPHGLAEQDTFLSVHCPRCAKPGAVAVKSMLGLVSGPQFWNVECPHCAHKITSLTREQIALLR